MVPRNSRPGLTLIELLVILALLAFLAGLLFPAVARVRGAAGRTVSVNNLKQIAIALHNCHDNHRRFPPIAGTFPPGAPSQGTIFFYLLPYLEQDNLYRKAEGYVWKKGTYGVPVRVLLSPQDKTAPPENRYQGWLATANYPANWLMFKTGGMNFANVTDGLSNTLAFGERYQVCGGHPCAWGYSTLYHWAPMFAYYSKARFQQAPSPEECDPTLAQALDRAGINAALGDGSVRLLANQVSPRTWGLLCDPADGQALGNDF